MTKKCLICETAFSGYTSVITPRKYCSHKCADIADKPRLLRLNLARKGQPQTHLAKFQFKKGNKPWNSELRGELSHAFGKKQSQKVKQFLSQSRRGENNPAWKGGTTWASSKIRSSKIYREWANFIYEKDSFTCVTCGYKSKGKVKGVRLDIHADHIKSFTDFPELRFDLDNGRTLCVPCHIKLTAIQNRERKLNANYESV